MKANPLTVRQVIAILRKMNPDAIVLSYSDAEGNDLHAVGAIEKDDAEGTVAMIPHHGTWLYRGGVSA